MIALTGATGFLGHYIAMELASQEQSLRCWYRPESDRSGFGDLAERIEWLPGSLGDDASTQRLVERQPLSSWLISMSKSGHSVSCREHRPRTGLRFAGAGFVAAGFA